MRMSRVRDCSGVALLAMLMGLVFTVQLSAAQAEDSCVSCHTDEAMLEKNLGKKDEKKSALQAGPG